MNIAILEENMDYISVREAAELWGVSERWAQKFCAEGRVPNAKRFGRSWMIPKDAVRPADLRRSKVQTSADEKADGE